MGLARRDAARSLEQTRADIEKMRSLLERYMPAPVETPNGERLLPCPYCGVLGGHVASCRLSTMSTGRVFEIVARSPQG